MVGLSSRISLKVRGPFSGQAGHSGWDKAIVRVWPAHIMDPLCQAQVCSCQGVQHELHFPALP